jgi:hypothetical protein
MRILVATAVAMALLTAPSYSQGMPGSQGMSSPDGTSGSQGSSRGKGRHGSSEKKAEAPTPKVDEGAYRSAIGRLPDQEYDPWRDLR